MKRFLFSFLALLSFVISAYADSFEVGGIWYRVSKESYDENPGEVYVTSKTGGYSDNIVIPATVTYTKTYNVIGIDSEAFKDCTKLTSVTIPEGVTKIAGDAFYGCSGLTSVTIPNSVTTIGYGAFYDCSGLTSVTIPNSVTSIGGSAFEGCSGLTSVIIPNSVTSIGGSAFEGCSGLTSVTIPNSVTTIGYGAFNGCSGLTSITIPEGVTKIEGYTFYGCSSLTSVIIPNSVTSIGGSAFNGCSGLTSVTIPEGVTKIEGYAFYGCSGLTSVTIPKGVTSIGYCAFRDCSKITSITIPEGVTIIEGNAFYGCSGLTSVIIPNSVTSIGAHAFEYCFVLTSVTIPNSVTSIGDYAFYGCSSLTSVTIPEGVTIIGGYAFWNCSSLSLVTSEISTPYDVNAFDCNYSATLIVPQGSRNDYNSKSGWNFALTYEKGEKIYDREPTDEQGVRYSLRQADDNSFYYAVTGHSDDMKLEIVIPDVIDGCPVRAIESAFRNCTGFFSVTIPNSVTSIGNKAFYGCSNLATVKLGRNIINIGDYAFYNCASLNSINLPNNLESIGKGAFKSEWWDNENYCPITSIVIPRSVKTIGDEAFFHCRKLVSVSIEDDEDGLTSIGNNAFQLCDLTSITIPNSVTTMGREAFAENSHLTTVILGEGITEIKDGMFRSCALASVTIPDRVSCIESNAFHSCSLTSVILPKSLTSMGENVFGGCPMKSIELPDAITVITKNMFKDSYYEYIKLGNNVKSIEKNAFGSSDLVIEISTPNPPMLSSEAFPNVAYLPDLTVIVPDAETETAYRNAAVWQEMTFSNQNNISEVTVDTPGDLSFELITECNMQPAKVVSLKVKGTINEDDFMQMRSNMKSLLRLDLSDCDITEIPDGGMTGKTQLQELILPAKLQTIGNNAFQNCPYLTGKLDIPSGVTSIGDYAFEGTNYTSVTLPAKLQSIGNYAFYKLPIKQSLNLPTALTKIGDYAFAETRISGRIEIPDGINYLGAGAFRNTLIDPVSLPDNPNGITSIKWGLFQGCSSFDYIYIPRNITEVSDYAFDGCSALTYVRMSPNLETLGEYAFQNTQLEYLKVPAKVEVLQRGVLKNCNSLESLSLPANLKSIGEEALMGCTALRNLSVEAVVPPTVDKSAIRGINTDLCLISIPTESYKPYVLAEYWGRFVQYRNDIAVETEGNGEIAFESVVEGEEGNTLSRTRTRGQRYAAARARTRGSEEEDDELQMTFANNGSSIYVPENGQVRFFIMPAEGETLVSATLNGVDITSLIGEDGTYTATADKKNGKLVVKFSDEAEQEPTGPAANGLAFSKNEASVKMGEAFTPPTLSNPNNLTLTWKSSDKTVATVNASTGEVTLVAPGETTITATFAGNDDYQAGSISYVLTVTKVDEGGEGGQDTPDNPTSTVIVKVSSAKQLPYCSDKDLDFTDKPELKAYVATGYDKTTGTIWLTRVKDVPANTGFLIMGEAGDYEVSVKEGGSNAYYKNMFKGTLEKTTLQTTETIGGKEYTNYYLSNGEQGVGFYKVTKTEGQSLGANRAYLPIPTDIPALGTAGGTETIKVSAAKQLPYYSANSLDFTDMPDVKAYTATGYDYKSGTIWLTRVKKVPAETGILIMAAKGDYPVPTTSVATVYGNMFKGSLTASTIYTNEQIDDKDYINYYLSNGDAGVGFYKVTKEEGVNLGANRCYLPIPKQTAAGTRGMDNDPTHFGFQESDEVITLRLFGSADGTTGIETNNREPITNNHWYNLQGQRVNNPGKGLYIHNGKKVVIN